VVGCLLEIPNSSHIGICNYYQTDKAKGQIKSGVN